ncbi:MAG TPA: c-type cytochrome biogenesis protein CcmI [Pseudolabrys sp.]|jgi:cytochrome c-type biogenesis protein CcmH
MTLWLAFALMTAATIFAVLWPLGRRKPLRPGSDIAVYRDQLDEIQRDRSTGLIGDAEAEAARVEVSRRLIAAADAAETERPAVETSSLWHRRVTAIAGLVLLPIGAVTLYLTLGSPDLPGEPLAARVQMPSETSNIQNMVAKVEDHLARNPKDGRAWEVLAPVYMRLGRYDDAVRAWRNAIAFNGSNGEREAELGQAMVAAANGVVTAEAKAVFERALTLDKDDVMARFYMGMAADQDGRRADADKIWGDLLASAPPGAPWIESVRHAMARTAPVEAAAPGAPAAPPADHDVNAMVERLANRLKKDGSDVQGWVQLVRSYRALGQNDKAQAAAADAHNALANDPEKLRQFAEGTSATPPATAEAPAAPTPPRAQAATPPGPTSSDIAAAEQMKPDQQNEMIRGMVARLADKLKQDGSDVAGWERLLRAYMVLGDHDKALAALADARRALAGDPDKLRRLDEVIKDLKVEG